MTRDNQVAFADGTRGGHRQPARRFAMTAAADFDPFAAHYLADPYPALARLRADEPVFFAPELDMWVLTRATDIEAVFTNPQVYSAAIAQDPLFPPAEAARDVLRTWGFDPPHTMSNLDPPEHRRIRTHNMRAFSARRIAELEPRVTQAAWEMVGAMLAGPPSTWSPSCRSPFRPT